MAGSPNYMFGIYNGSGANESIRQESEQLQQYFEEYFKQANIDFKLTEFDGRSDYGPFIENGIPAGGLFTGAEGLKTEGERDLWGGFANAQYDPCYHQYCDDIRNINQYALEHNLKAASYVLQKVGSDPNLKSRHDTFMNQGAAVSGLSSIQPHVYKQNVIPHVIA